MKQGGFNLRKWLSNSKQVMKKINSIESQPDVNPKKPNSIEDDQSFAKASLKQCDMIESEEPKVLGLVWDSERDLLKFNLIKLLEAAADMSATKRAILGLIAKIFDPLGLITPVTTPLKVFLQRLFVENLEWDEALPDILLNQWNFLVSKMKKPGDISIPRYYFGDIDEKPTELELYGFCDSSEQAYAAAVYTKITVKGRPRTCLVMSKSRVAPLSKLTIPRLELLSALILARLIDTVKGAFSSIFSTKIVRCWTDSITTILDQKT